MHRQYKTFMEATKDNKEFNVMKKHEQKNNMFDIAKTNRRETLINCTYWKFT